MFILLLALVSTPTSDDLTGCLESNETHQEALKLDA